MRQCQWIVGASTIASYQSTTQVTLANDAKTVCSGSTLTITTITVTNASGVAETPASAFANPILANTTPSNNATMGYQVVNMPSGTAAQLTGCSNALFNVPTHTISSHTVPIGIGPTISTGNLPWNGTYSASNTTITYPWGTSGSVTDGSCVLSNVMGGPYNMLIQNVTMITDATHTIGQGASLSQGPNFAYQNAYRHYIPERQRRIQRMVQRQLRGHGRHSDRAVGDGLYILDGCVSVVAGPHQHQLHRVRQQSALWRPIMYRCRLYPAIDDVLPNDVVRDRICLQLLGGDPVELARLSWVRGDIGTYNGLGVTITGSNSIDNAQTRSQYTCLTPCGTPGPFPY